MGANTNVTLVATENNKSKNDIAIKLHRHFAHPLPEKLLELLNSAGDPWQSDKELKELRKSVMNPQSVKYIEKHHEDQLQVFSWQHHFRNVSQ